MSRQPKVPLRAVFSVGVVALLLFVLAVMLDPAVLGAAGDIFRRPASTVSGNWVLLAAVAFPTIMLGLLVAIRGAT